MLSLYAVIRDSCKSLIFVLLCDRRFFNFTSDTLDNSAAKCDNMLIKLLHLAGVVFSQDMFLWNLVIVTGGRQEQKLHCRSFNINIFNILLYTYIWGFWCSSSNLWVSAVVTLIKTFWFGKSYIKLKRTISTAETCFKHCQLSKLQLLQSGEWSYWVENWSL